MAERRRGREWSHPPWSPRPRNAHEGPWNGLYPAGYKLVRRAPHACKGLALDRNEIIAETNAGGTQQENICDLYDDVTDVGAPSSPAPSAHRKRLWGLTNVANSVKGSPCLQRRTVSFAETPKYPLDTRGPHMSQGLLRGQISIRLTRRGWPTRVVNTLVLMASCKTKTS